ncbi:hypothetical protein SAMN05444007_102203 [Cribrihabitans marinus]|uniref:Uncharacterized protein n=1 Tax=Cribrihabitans marinus TaxID=1227549 RepID=A0A1H6SW10_9RHOB|nr:CTP synthetase [Cribrihabitans marinus]GGH22743.1 hypothetical protein GCM10010973_08220 [Cribrihabitans marinus]SEI72139.1 hypothetical protein SAMN05444007_102203 [Cribrihabitans marinus]
MLPLTLIIHIFLGSTPAGSAVIAVLAMSYATLTPILISAVAGIVAALPISVHVARRLAG